MIRLTITKYVATSRNPGGPKARHVSVPSKKAAAMPEGERPATRMGEPPMKMRKLLRREDFQVAGDDWRMEIVSETAPCNPVGRALGVMVILGNVGVSRG